TGSTENGAVTIDPTEGQTVSFNIIPGTDYVKHGGIVNGDFPGLAKGGLNGEYVDNDKLNSYGWRVGDDFDEQREITFLFAKVGTVSFNPLAGSYTPADTHDVDALEHTLSTLDPTCEIGTAKRRGARFSGWQVAGTAYTLAAGNTVKYETHTSQNNVVEVDLVAYSGSAERFRVNAEQSGIVLVAQYEVVSVPTVRIDLALDGGTLNGMPDPEIASNPDDPGVYAVLNGAMREYILGTPVKPGYTFSGWKYSENTIYTTGTKFEYAVNENDDFKTTLTIAGSSEILSANRNITLTAQWVTMAATSPIINTQPASNTELVYGYADKMELIVGVTPAPTGEEQTYQWYTCDENGNNKVAITGATGPDYEFPPGKDAGDYYFMCDATNTRKDNGDSKTVSSSVAKVTVKPRPVTLVWSKNSFQYNGDEKSITAIVENVVPGNSVTVTSYTANQMTDVGDYIAIANGLSDSNYTLTGGTNAQKSWSITNRVITVTANDHTITYGDAPSGGGVTYSGFVPGEDERMITGTVSYAFDYNRYDNTGSYTITPIITGLSSTNYTFRVETGTLTVRALPIVLDWSEGDFTYDGAQKNVSASVANAVNNDTVTVLLFANNQKTNAGNYTARATLLSDSNYTLTSGTNVTNNWLIRKKQPTLETGTTTVSSAGASVDID
ncbi:hypothetical protein LJB83_03305, partial [Clostridia bacterium OttesenSCG-928-F22]|nr:hypothetical protein [Clostridia bacterium OttesenSCG-928-F22]